MSANRVHSWLRRLKPYNTRLIVVGFALDALVVAWAYMDNQFPPLIYAALTFVLKLTNLAVHFINKKLTEVAIGDETDTAAG